MSDTPDKPPPEALDYFREMGKRGGRLGAPITNAKLTTAKRKRAGRKAAAKLTPEERRARAQKAAAARWKKGKDRKNETK